MKQRRGAFAYVSGQSPTGDTIALMRLRYAGCAARRGFAIYRAGHEDHEHYEDYEGSILPTGHFAGTPEEALDCAAGLYLGDDTDDWV